MCKTCTKEVHFGALSNTQVVTGFGMCQACTKHSIAEHFEQEPYHRFLRVYVITGLGMCKVCTEAVLCVGR